VQKLQYYISDDYRTNDNFFLEADGFIVKDGIKYREGK